MTPAPSPRLAAAVAVIALLACTHAPRVAPLPSVAWPEGPAAPRARLAAIFPDPSAPPPRRSWLRAVLDVVAGAGEADRRRAAALERPFGVAAAPDGSFIVADPDAPAVLRVAARGVPERVTCAGRDWSAPMAVALAPDGALFVADAGAGEIVKVGPGGRCSTLGAGRLERPTGVALDGERLLVVDPPRHELVVLSRDDAVLARWGTRGEGDGQLHFPTAVARSTDGTILVVDALNFRIARFSAGGEWLGAFGEAGLSGGALARPKAVALDPAGRIYVSDAQRDVVLVYSPAGEFECALSAGGTGPGRLTMPAGLAVTGSRLYVADSLNHRVQVFELL